MPPSIRPARPDDVESLARLFGELSGHAVSREEAEDRLAFVGQSPFDSLFVCEDEGAVIGAMGFRIRENIEQVSRFGEISALVVDTGRRGQGVGRLMVAYAERLAAERGCVGTWLVSGFGREEAAHPFYKRLGYEVTGYRFVKR
jgi:GNAT superfamily N-acetyltransferase